MSEKAVASSAYVERIQDMKVDLEKALEFVGWRNELKRDSTVFVKPNFTYPSYREGITTNPALLRALLGILKNRADRVLVGESDGGYNSFSADDAFEGHGMHDMCRDTGAELVNLSKLKRSFVEGSILRKRVKVQLPDILMNEVDCLISVPVLKVHVMTGVSLGIKNLWGCYPDTMRCLHHKHLDMKLALITKTIKPRLVLIDGTYSLDGHGPMYGETKKTDLVLASNNAVASDALGAAVMGIPIKRARHISVAEKAGLGTANLRYIRINDGWQQWRMHFHIQRTLLDRSSALIFNSDGIARLVMDSPLTPAFYRVASLLRNPEEMNIASEMKEYRL